MAYLSPNSGGCWFCQTDNTKEGWLFSWEFDTHFHPSCCMKELEDHPDNPEAKIIFDEFDGFKDLVIPNNFLRRMSGKYLPIGTTPFLKYWNKKNKNKKTIK
jgi:hypothetical protein